ncbi:MAG: ECF transporter S component [Candidatus Desulforudis sp.]|nr:ECF transporter S component [Desulforudis sp.]
MRPPFARWRWLPPAVMTAALVAVALLAAAGERLNWGVFAALLVVGLLLAGFVLVERRRSSTRELALVATLAALTAAARLPFAGLPGFQPTTFLTIVSGVAFGPWAGFSVGATAGALSNFFLGQGPWTPWQMLGWGLAGASAGALRRILSIRLPFVLAGFGLVWGYLFGWLVNLWVWTSAFHPLSLESFLAVQVLSFGFDTAHALGNAVFCLFFGREALKILGRFREKLAVREWSENETKKEASGIK